MLSLEKTQGRHDNRFQKCERMLWKRNTTKTSELFRWDRAMNFKCKQRQYVTGQNLPTGRMDKCQKRLHRKTVKFQTVWSYSRSYLPGHSYVLCATKVPWSKRMCEYLTDLWQIALFYSLVLHQITEREIITELVWFQPYWKTEFWLCATPLFKCKMESIDIFLGLVLEDKDDI